MVKKKRQSKRLTFKNKYKIQRKVKEHDRKLRREAKKNPQLRKRLNKDPGVPNLWPYKDVLLKKTLAEREEKIENEKEKQENESKKRKRTPEELMEKFKKEVEKRNSDYDSQQVLLTKTFNLKDSSKKTFFRDFKKVVKAADVILEVLDARDPLGSRSPQIEKQILGLDPNKKIIIVLNKIDLIPKTNMLEWLSYFRNEFPTIAFKCTRQQQKKNLGQAKVSAKQMKESTLATNQCLGADTLVQLLKNYSRSSDSKSKISVGIIGFPNVGKSSLINSLKRSKAVGVGARPGFTRSVTEVVLDKNITLIDCPGIIFSTDMSEADAALRNCVKFEQLENYMLPVDSIISKCSQGSLMQIYKIPAFKDASEFIRLVAQKRGRIKKGGITNEEEGAKMIINDWNTGKIPYYTLPPETKKPINATIVSQWSTEFKLDDVMEFEKENVINKLADVPHSEKLIFASAITSTEVKPDDMFMNLDSNDKEDSEEENVEKMEEEGVSHTFKEDLHKKESRVAIAPIKEKSNNRPLKKRRKDPELEQKQINTTKKKQFKLDQREIRKEEKSDQPMAIENDSYDFGVDFWKSSKPTIIKDNGENQNVNAFNF